jgi:hypothetical protein
MEPKVVQDAGYTAVGLGVLALQAVLTHRRELSERLSTELNGASRQVRAVLAEVQTRAVPVTSRLESLPRLPGPLGQILEDGRERLCSVLRPGS